MTPTEPGAANTQNEMNNEDLKFILENALRYIEGAYECAFPDASDNEYWANEVRRAIVELSKEPVHPAQPTDRHIENYREDWKVNEVEGGVEVTNITNFDVVTQPTDRPAAVWSARRFSDGSWVVLTEKESHSGDYDTAVFLCSELNRYETETAALRDELERAKAENERLRSGLSADLTGFVQWIAEERWEFNRLTGTWSRKFSYKEPEVKNTEQLIAAFRGREGK